MAKTQTDQQREHDSAEEQSKDAAKQPVTATPPTGGPTTPAADAHDAALDQEVDTFGVVTADQGPAS